MLVLTVPLRDGARYPSVNHSVRGSASYGAKTDDYNALAADVEEAAGSAVAAGWETIAYPCRAWITRYVPDARVFDALNLGQCEANALTRAGVWTDDQLACPIMLDVQPKCEGPDRVVIVVQRLAPPMGLAPRAPRPKIAKRRRGPAAAQTSAAPTPGAPGARTAAKTTGWRAGDPIPDGFALLGRELVPIAEAMALIGGDRKDAAPRARRAAR